MELPIGAKISHEKFGEGVICGASLTSYTIFFRNHGDVQISKNYEGFDVLRSEAEVSNSIGLEDIEKAVVNVMKRYSDITMLVPMGERWNEGTLILKPGNPDLQSKEMPIDTFFHKIVMVRDRLRVLEQNINSHKVLSDEDKIGLQQYITRIYGSLTTFNVLFSDKESYFKGEGKR